MMLFVRNMVCDRCKAAVSAVFRELKINTNSVELGEVTLADKPGQPQLEQLDAALRAVGFELIDDRKGRLIEQLKKVVMSTIHNQEEQPRIKYSEFLAQQLHQEYTYLSKLFSEVEGITIEQYIIKQKIEKVKELLVYDELSLSEIADRLSYSSVAHLSAQFKKVTGLTPGFYKNKSIHDRIPLDKV
ncbi:MAG: AraC family transcriptional regulator [Bacteroidota bacterium]